MLTIEQLLEYDCDTLILLIKDNNPIIKEALKDIRIKKNIINTAYDADFYDVLRYLQKEDILSLFDDEGIKILKNAPNLANRLDALLTIRDDYQTCIFKNNNFCQLVNDNINGLKTTLKHLEVDSASLLVNYISQNHPDNLMSALLAISFASQQEIVKTTGMSLEMIKKIIPKIGGKSANYLLNNIVGLPLNDYDFEDLYSIVSKHITIPINYLQQDFLKKITTMYSVKDYRFLVNEFSHNNDPSLIEEKRKEYYNEELMSYDADNQMIKRFSLCYQELCSLMDDKEVNTYKIEAIVDKYFNFFGTNSDLQKIKHLIYKYMINKAENGLKECFQQESNLQISNMIIDYHFEDVPYNFFLDIEELVRFQEGEGKTLNDEELIIYKRLLNIDSLTYEEKISLHKTLLQTNWIEKNYDIFRKAKDKAISLMKEKMLNEETIQKFYDENLSKQYGVPVYILDGSEFYAFVKSLPKEKRLPLFREDIESNVDGCSYSLDGSQKLNTYRNPKICYNLIFSDFPSNQIVHMHLVDSFSKYVRTSLTPATNRVNELYTPKELVEKSSNYNELVLSQKNSWRQNDEVNERLGLPKMLGIYCYDEFWDIDVDSAKELGIGIVVVKTKSYDSKNEQHDYFEQLKVSISDSKQYLNDVHYDDMYKRRAK